MIPKVIHQIWVNGSDIPQDAYRIEDIHSWKKWNPTWEYRLWNKDECESIMDMYPEIKEVYMRAQPAVQRDVARIAILIEYGGIYTDINTMCLMTFDDTIEETMTVKNNSQSFIMAPKGAAYLVQFLRTLTGKRNIYQPLQYAGSIAMSSFDTNNNVTKLMKYESNYCTPSYGIIVQGVTRSSHT
jgi:mannosyltransferase OCH1-like enzyme